MEREIQRLTEARDGSKHWRRWGPFLSERQWGTVREDYSVHGNSWDSFPHDHARRRAYRWGEDGLQGWTDRQCRLCFAPALWNTNDTILKERLFGLNGNEGNHGEDVKECYYYLDSTPTHSYTKALYKYPQGKYPYTELRLENQRLGRLGPHDGDYQSATGGDPLHRCDRAQASSGHHTRRQRGHRHSPGRQPRHELGSPGI